MGTERLPATQEADGEATSGSPLGRAPAPGLLLVFSGGEPRCTPVPLGADPVLLGRGLGPFAAVNDAMLSRSHARAAWADGRFEITDLGSRNGSALDGEPLQGTRVTSGARVLRLGHSLFLLCADLSPFQQLGVQLRERRVEGPALQRTVLSVAKAAPLSRTLFVSGESGAGKEWLARVFHQAGPQRGGPFVAVNGAAIPEGIAERLLFGAVKGAYSGATADSQGYIQAANGGTLFLDEVGDLDIGVQAKLLRVLESGELSPLGATRAHKVDVRVCCATCKDLRALVAANKFRADLYFRIGVPQVSVPPLRERLEEIPWLAAGAIRAAAPDLRVHAALVEACLLRPWPGNVRELLAEVQTAAVQALAAGAPAASAAHLRAGAGEAIVPAAREPAPEAAPSSPAAPPSEPASAAPQADAAPTRAQVLAALAEANGNISAAARALKLHRTQLRRLFERHGIDARRLRDLARR
ncbi:sigma 54-interacting transcriptional regulator [Sorangium sp. So ce1000]|uniref:sigma 54-interacting transcriptional regulator n=1 Tax=Sorangium sp. So ce1000 TaxID=3133325 RepID=UPI003F5FBFA7